MILQPSDSAKMRFVGLNSYSEYDFHTEAPHGTHGTERKTDGKRPSRPTSVDRRAVGRIGSNYHCPAGSAWDSCANSGRRAVVGFGGRGHPSVFDRGNHDHNCAHDFAPELG